jgi:hypothetical protein
MIMDATKEPHRFCGDCGKPMAMVGQGFVPKVLFLPDLWNKRHFWYKAVGQPINHTLGYDEENNEVIYFVECLMRCPKHNGFTSKHKDVSLLWCKSLGRWILKV